jgi:glutathione S-transferase
MIKLYGFPGTRSSRVQWLLEEAQLPYELELVDVMSGGHKKPEHVARHAHGLVPALEDGDLRIIESAAMCLHVADLAEGKLAPAVGTADRARYYQWVVYAASTLDPTIIGAYMQLRFVPAEHREAKVVEQSKKTFAICAGVLTEALGSKPYLLGEALSAADVVVGYDLALAHQLGWLDEHPTLKSYTERLVARPAFQKAHPQRG